MVEFRCNLSVEKEQLKTYVYHITPAFLNFKSAYVKKRPDYQFCLKTIVSLSNNVFVRQHFFQIFYDPLLHYLKKFKIIDTGYPRGLIC